MQQQQRRLAAILFTDIVGSTSMMQKDEQVAMSVNKRYTAVLKQSVLSHGGEILNDFGDGSLCSFSSATEALNCAIEMQQQFQQEPKVPLRIGLHVGEIFFENEKVFGDGVNVASRVQSLGIANSILFSSEICSKIKNQQEFKSVSLGRFHFKNVDEPMEVFALSNGSLAVPQKKQIEGKFDQKGYKKKWLIVTAIILLLGLVFISYTFLGKKNSLTDTEKSIAILPFEIMGNNEDNLASGLVEDILVHLSKITEFNKVISNKSSSNYRGTTKNLKEVGEELGAIYLVTGSIQQIGNKIHVNAQLTDSRNGKTIWADDYTKENIEVFALQAELATQIVQAMKTQITPEEKKGLSKRYTDNIEAYKLYRKGRFFWDQRTKESFDTAEVYYKKAIDLDPDYALAYSGLADCYLFNQKGLSQLQAIPIARVYADKALSLDSTLTEALTSVAFIESFYNYKWKVSGVLFKKIINSNPNYPFAHLYYGNVLLCEGNVEEGLSETKKALSLDPLSPVINYVLGRNYYHGRKFDLAISQLRKNLTLNPKFILSNISMGFALVQQKLYSRAIEAFSKLPKTNFDQGSNGFLLLSYTYILQGDKKRGKTVLDQVSEEQRSQCPYLMSLIYQSIRDTTNSLIQMEYAYDSHSLFIPFIKVDPALDPIRNFPTFKALLKKMNLE